MVGTSKDGAYVYFVANGILSEEANGAGQKAKAGKANLYLFHEGEAGVRFIGTLAGEDDLDWDSPPRSQSARVSADGRHLAFVSIEAEELAGGYDNTIAEGTKCQPNAVSNELGGGPRCPEAFVYDAESKELTCASCSPSGSRPLGPTQLPGASNPYEGPRYLSADGSRLYFESRDALLPGDENQKRDVYEFERAGKGSCTSESPSFDSASGGCLFLISSGRSESDSYLLDASADGRDVFLSTRSALVGWDTNENYDVYDARTGGGFPEPNEVSVCEGEACRPPAAPTPGVFSPPTASFQGLGNLSPLSPPAKCAKGFTNKGGKCVKQPVTCRKGFVKKKGKCVKAKGHSKKRKGHKSKKRAHHKRGARR